MLRETQRRDLPEIGLLLSKAFTQARSDEGLKQPLVPMCRREFLEMYLAANPGGSFVIEKGHKVVAYCFSRLWGTVGWLGPLSVLPSEQGRGLGKEIVRAAVEHLKSQNAATIGLELSSRSPKNLAFYTKLGFLPGKVVVDLIHDLAGLPTIVPSDFEVIQCAPAAGSEDWHRNMERARNVSGSLVPGLNLEKEVLLANEFEFGDGVIFLRDGEPVAFAIVHTETYSEDEERFFLKVNVLQLRRSEPVDTLEHVVAGLGKIAHAAGLRGLYIRSCTRHYLGFKWLLLHGFKAIHNELRMTLDGFPQNDDPRCVNFSKWE